MGYLDSQGLAYFWEKVKAYADDHPYLVKAPVGAIVVWSGTADDIPAGWALCDGTNGTPDLRGKFILCAGGTYNPGAVGGSEEVTLTVEQMPTHSHAETISQTGTAAGAATTSRMMGAGAAAQNTSYFGFYSNLGNVRGPEATTLNTGGSKAHPNMPPYYALCYIIKVAPDPALDGVTMELVNEAIQDAVGDISAVLDRINGEVV